MRPTCVSLVACLIAALSASTTFAAEGSAAEGAATKRKEKAFRSIFNGKDLTGWEGDPRLWSVQDGVIVGQSTEANKVKYNTFLIWRGGEVADFILKASYRLENHNSGIQYRSKDLEGVQWGIGGYQADLAEPGWISGICYEEKGRGVLAKQGQKVRIKADGEIELIEQFATAEEIQKKLKVNDWNHYEVIVRNNHATQKINGQVTCEVIDEQIEKAATKGLIAFQLHVGPPMKVEFRDICLRHLDTEGSATK